MPTRLLLDGPDIETVLTRVQEEHGSAARIVRAERVRSGGLAGFFAKERYEVSVEVDPTIDEQPAHRDASPDLAHRAASYGEPVTDDDLPPALRVAQEMDGILPAPEPEPVAARVSTHGTAFADVLGSITASLGPADQVAPYGASREAVPTDDNRPDDNHADVDVDHADVDRRAPVVHVELLDQVPDGDMFVPSPPPTIVRPTGKHAIGAAPARPAVLTLAPATLAAPARSAAPARCSATATAGASPVPYEPRWPAPMRPTGPPCTPGAVLVLVGDARVGTRAAHDLARTMRIDPTGVLLAATSPRPDVVAESHRLSSPPEARVAAGRLMMAAQPGIVVVDHPIGADAGWTNAVLDALGATAVWAVVDATRKAEDLARWARALLRVDALVVHNVAATDDISSVIALGRPLALLDAQPATGPAWHALEDLRDR